MSLNPKISDWRGKRVWLLGASEGIGAELAKQLHALGARLALSSRRAESLSALGLPDVILAPCDVKSEESVLHAAQQIVTAWGGVDVAVYLAGDYTPLTADNFNVSAAEHLFQVNFIGALRFYSALSPHLQQGGGVGFVASVAGYAGLPKALGYGPSKAALLHFAQCLYHDLSPKGIGVWVINPGFVATRLTAQNDFKMPALMSVASASRAIIDGFAQGDFDIHFPKRFSWTLKFMASLPYRLYFPLIRRITGL